MFWTTSSRMKSLVHEEWLGDERPMTFRRKRRSGIVPVLICYLCVEVNAVNSPWSQSYITQHRWHEHDGWKERGVRTEVPTTSASSSIGKWLRGGEGELQEVIVRSNMTLLDFVQRGQERRRVMSALEEPRVSRSIAIPPGLWMWDWRVMSPWLKRVKDERAQFPLSPRPGSELHIRGLGNINQPSRLDGQWDIPPACWGSFREVELCHRTQQCDGRELLLLNSGPWTFDQCQLRASGCQAIRCERQTELSISRSFVGGYRINTKG
jgi:hypothetical protein